MPNPSGNGSILTLKVQINPACKNEFVEWQSELHETIAAFRGFSSLEISSTGEKANSWVIVQRFQDRESTTQWLTSGERNFLIDQLRNYVPPNQPLSLQDLEGDSEGLPSGVIEVFVTHVSADKQEAYREWIAKIHQTEALFPGFQGVYVQSPKKDLGRHWITFLKFDKQENLDNWLSSKERAKVLEEAKPLIESIESHRVISPYAGWFADPTTGAKRPAVWKQTMLILLVLFPIVMLESKFLPFITGGMNSSFSTFIGNAISVALISWPMMPIALFFLGWWLQPHGKKELTYTLLGTLLLIVIYCLEIALFWKLL